MSRTVTFSYDLGDRVRLPDPFPEALVGVVESLMIDKDSSHFALIVWCTTTHERQSRWYRDTELRPGQAAATNEERAAPATVHVAPAVE